MKQKTLFIVAAVSLLLAFASAALLVSRQQGQAATEVAAANRDALARGHSPTLGRADAPVTIVEFFDPACETCGAFYPKVKQLMAAHPDKIRLVLRYAPFHDGSDKVVAVLEAARRQDKFWPALEAVLASQREWAPNHRAQVGLVWKPLEGLGLDMERMALDMTDPAIGKLIEQDLADARTLNVTMTPEFFVNARPLPSFGYEQLKSLVDEAVAATR